MKVAVIGGGAAGFFAALSVKEHHPSATVLLIEKANKLLSKVRVSGGGRCNVTHHCFEIKKLSRNYPRGERFLRKTFEKFSSRETIAWFASRGVKLKAEADGRMFPITDNSQTIIDALMNAATLSQVMIVQGDAVIACAHSSDQQEFQITFASGKIQEFDRLIIATGGNPKREAYEWLEKFGHSIIPPVPSLFTFNMPEEPIKELMGVVADPVRARIIGTDLESSGPLLITHWGMSGPAILKLSAWGARIVYELDHKFTLQLNWVGGRSEEEIRTIFKEQQSEPAGKQIINAELFGLPKRLWRFLLLKASVPLEKRYSDLAKKERDRLIDLLTNDRYIVNGKTTFKEEFVTAGGVDLNEVDPRTMQSRIVPGLYFAGEVLDIDGITGGFNFQAAWSTGSVAGKLMD
ncbi:MAG: NAD(P)/FAD-dependent oxidoreductase [Bacteroidota bacterium]|nr:NAD(P)/FAD-dependent oxidoreductase [Bacteroidota bacterium]